MYYGAIKNCDIANGEGVRVSLFVSGCTNHCKGCIQPQTWDFHYGKPFTEETEAEILSLLSPYYIAGLTLLGGEPLEPSNQRALLPFLRTVKKMYPEKNLWCFTGYTFEQLVAPDFTEKKLQFREVHPRCEVTDEILKLLDVLVDGRFVQNLKDITLRFRGSRNQRLIDLKKTREVGTLVFLPDNEKENAAFEK